MPLFRRRAPKFPAYGNVPGAFKPLQDRMQGYVEGMRGRGLHEGEARQDAGKRADWRIPELQGRTVEEMDKEIDARLANEAKNKGREELLKLFEEKTGMSFKTAKSLESFAEQGMWPVVEEIMHSHGIRYNREMLHAIIYTAGYFRNLGLR